ncbi:zinc finger protein 740 isoform X1 [Ursus maritimus]|uniref:Zinc finger protein 740 isoform X1 n=2 Tax=Caniformia TaxID=379584 RepID=A0A8M1GRW8_URSMA|nr:zinc finger protein 740 isoform X1 [Ursus maritimus]
MAQASLLACEGLAGVSLVPTAASKKMMLSQIASKQAENGERAGSPDVLRCSSQGHRKDSDKSRSRKDDDSLAEASHSKKTVKKVVVVEQNGSFQVKIPKNFICEHCFGAFRSSYHLKRHILIHTGEKPFECDICDMRFIQKYHLERHKRVHSGEKPYQCERCHQVSSSIHATQQTFSSQEPGPAPVPFPSRGHIKSLAMVELVRQGELCLSGLMQLCMGRGHENNRNNNSISCVLTLCQAL